MSCFEDYQRSLYLRWLAAVPARLPTLSSVACKCKLAGTVTELASADTAMGMDTTTTEMVIEMAMAIDSMEANRFMEGTTTDYPTRGSIRISAIATRLRCIILPHFALIRSDDIAIVETCKFGGKWTV